MESALEPTMSQNITVSWRRSGDDADWVGTRRQAAGFGAVAILAVRLAPHSGQNLALGGLAAPQAGHDAGQGRTALGAKLGRSGHRRLAARALHVCPHTSMACAR